MIDFDSLYLGDKYTNDDGDTFEVTDRKENSHGGVTIVSKQL